MPSNKAYCTWVVQSSVARNWKRIFLHKEVITWHLGGQLAGIKLMGQNSYILMEHPLIPTEPSDHEPWTRHKGTLWVFLWYPRVCAYCSALGKGCECIWENPTPSKRQQWETSETSMVIQPLTASSPRLQLHVVVPALWEFFW